MTAPDPNLIKSTALQLSHDDFFAFVWRVFETLHPHPDDHFDAAWHVRAMCHELDEVRLGDNKRLVITIPPRCLKSVTVAVA